MAMLQQELMECFAFHRSLRDNILFRKAKQYIIVEPFFIELNQAPSIIPELSTSYPNNITLNGNFQVQWNTTPGTELYYLQLSNDGTFTSDVYSIYTKNNYYNFNSMAPGTYIFRIASLNSYGQTGWSGVAGMLRIPSQPPKIIYCFAIRNNILSEVHLMCMFHHQQLAYQVYQLQVHLLMENSHYKGAAGMRSIPSQPPRLSIAKR